MCIRDSDRTEFYIGDICVAPVPIHHDAADPTGFAFFGAGRKVGVMTDTGHITRDMPVSYTHLDVYKRQQYGSITRFPFFPKRFAAGVTTVPARPR